MAEQSYLFDFTRTEDFFENFNLKFKVSDMYKVTGINSTTGAYTYESDNVGNNFQLVLVFHGGTNLSDYLDSSASYSKLDENEIEDHHMTLDVGLDWYNKGDGEISIELHGTSTFEIGDESKPIKAIFLRTTEENVNYVMGYSINTRPFSVTNQVVFDDDVIFWDISRYE